MATFQQVHIYASKDGTKTVDLGKFTTAAFEANDKGGTDVVVYPHKRTLLRSEVRTLKDTKDPDNEQVVIKWRLIGSNATLFDWFEVTTVDV
jgi:hypothetical protein